MSAHGQGWNEPGQVGALAAEAQGPLAPPAPLGLASGHLWREVMRQK